MTASHVTRVLVLLDLLKGGEQGRPQGGIEGDIDRTIVVFQAAASHRLAGVFFQQQAVGGELQALALVRAVGRQSARLALHREALAVLFQDIVRLAGESVPVGGEGLIVAAGVHVYDVLGPGGRAGHSARRGTQEERQGSQHQQEDNGVAHR